MPWHFEETQGHGGDGERCDDERGQHRHVTVFNRWTDTVLAGSTATMRRDQSDARECAGVKHEPYRRQTHGRRRRVPGGIVTARAGGTGGSEKAGSFVACAGAACGDGGVTRS